ncbi:unnamed protein product [Hydatigera taeniaeformis]|uniref:Cytosolic Fe-S cluster assembly factor NUBP2 homolog n=1 Tax=Hydatigena taeniaeformis TaxID=6205 RepID=A0A0R3X5X9_HYDTA|nr:unnamed protein product [Hydatigera taeniaeformis]
MEAGPVENVSLKDGYGFVTYEDEESVLYACSLFEGIRLYNYELRIKPRQGSKYENHPIKSYPPYTCVLSCSPDWPCEFREYSHLSDYHCQNSLLDLHSVVPITIVGGKFMRFQGMCGVLAITKIKFLFSCPHPLFFLLYRAFNAALFVFSIFSSLGDMNSGIGHVQNIFIVTSGKGGVGKSTIACRLAIGLAKRNLRVGLLDLDLCGPSVPRIMGLCDANVQQCSEGWLPVVADKVAKNIFVMSIAFLVSDKDSAVAWRGPRKNAMIDQFLSKVCWGQLDVLVIDTPPGTSDEHISVVEKIRMYASDRLRGAIIVSTPQRVALCDIRRQLTFCSKIGLLVVGLIENMSGFECLNCKESFNLFASGGVEALANEKGVDFLGKFFVSILVTVALVGARLKNMFPFIYTLLGSLTVAKPADSFLGRLPLDCQITRISDQSATFAEKSQLALPVDSPIMVHILGRYFGAERLTS